MGLPPESPMEPTAPPHENPSSIGNSPGGAFEWNIPTYFVKLPTQGRYYPEGHPCHNRDTIEIRYMTAKEEDILTSENLLKEGVAINRAVQNMVLDKSINLQDLLIQDRNALTVAARITGYGPEYQTKVRCPSCTIEDGFSFNLEDVLERGLADTIESMDKIGEPEHDESGNLVFNVYTPITKATVGCKFLTGADEEKLAKETYLKTVSNTTITALLRAIIVSVNGETNPLVLASFVHNLPTQDSNHLKKEYVKNIPSYTLKQQYKCQSCGHSVDMEVPLNPDFFWPGSDL